jgi:hypothetical protein
MLVGWCRPFFHYLNLFWVWSDAFFGNKVSEESYFWLVKLTLVGIQVYLVGFKDFKDNS